MSNAADEDAQAILTTAYEEIIGDGQTWEDLIVQDPNHWFALGIAQAIGLMEGGYGKNFHNNWGAITRKPNADGSCPADSFVHGDSSFELGEYQTCFRSYETPLEGAKDLLRKLYIDRPNTFAAAMVGDIRGVAQDMYATHYYMGVAPHEQKDDNGDFTNVNKYISFIGRGVNQIADLYPSGESAASPGESSNGFLIAAVSGIALLGLVVALKS